MFQQQFYHLFCWSLITISYVVKKSVRKDGITSYSDGIQVEDVTIGTEAPEIGYFSTITALILLFLTDICVLGEKVILNTKVYFSGLQIKAFNGGRTISKVIYGDDISMSSAFGQLKLRDVNLNNYGKKGLQYLAFNGFFKGY